MNKLKQWFLQKVFGVDVTVEDLRQQMKQCIQWRRKWKANNGRQAWRGRMSDPQYRVNHMMFCAACEELERIYRSQIKGKHGAV